MRTHVFIIAKPGEERRYAQCVEPAPDRVQALREQGYRIIAVSYDLPPEFRPEDYNVKGRVKGRTE